MGRLNLIDLKKLEEDLTSEDIISLVCGLGADRYEEKENCIIFPTICHNICSEDAHMKLYYYKRNHKFHCYTDCGDNFNIFELFKRRYELLGINYNFFKDIVLKITKDNFYTENFFNKEQVYKTIYDNSYQYNITVDLPILPAHLLNTFCYYEPPEWLNEGIGADQLKRFNIRFSINQNKIIIPHYDVDNNLIGIRARALNEEDIAIGKYMPIQIENKIYAHPLGYNLYGLNLNKNNIARKKVAIIFESEKAVMQFDAMFGEKENIAVAVCGSTLSRYQIELLKKVGAEKVIIAFDSPANVNDYKQLNEQYDKIIKLCQKYSYLMTMGYILDRQKILSNKESPTDKGKQVFLKLLKNVKFI